MQISVSLNTEIHNASIMSKTMNGLSFEREASICQSSRVRPEWSVWNSHEKQVLLCKLLDYNFLLHTCRALRRMVSRGDHSKGRHQRCSQSFERDDLWPNVMISLIRGAKGQGHCSRDELLEGRRTHVFVNVSESFPTLMTPSILAVKLDSANSQLLDRPSFLTRLSPSFCLPALAPQFHDLCYP